MDLQDEFEDFAQLFKEDHKVELGDELEGVAQLFEGLEYSWGYEGISDLFDGLSYSKLALEDELEQVAQLLEGLDREMSPPRVVLGDELHVAQLFEDIGR